MDGFTDVESLLDPKTQSDPKAFYAHLHETAPVYIMPETGFYVVTRYDDLRAVLRDTETFSNDTRDTGGLNTDHYHVHSDALRERGWSHVQVLQRTDPPVHGRYRRLLDQVFNIQRINALIPRIEAVTNDLIDGFIDKGECEFVSEFALPLPGIIIAEQLGLAPSEIATFKHWADSILAPTMVRLTAEQMAEVAETELEMQHYLARAFEDRRANPRDDMMSALLHAHGEAGEAPLTMHELQNLMHQLISGGYDTVIAALANGLWLLIRHPDQMARLRADPSLMRGFIDEALRLESPVQGLIRRATRDVEVGGTLIPEGATVITRYGAANLDAAKFECPHAFDIGRRNAGAHMAFGIGAHFCVGRLLARQEMLTGFTLLLERLDDIRLARDLPDPPHIPSFLLHGMKELPIRFRGVATPAGPN